MKPILILLLFFSCSEASYKKDTIIANENNVLLHMDTVPHKDTILQTFYINGNTKDIVIKTDSDERKEYISYYSNGNVKEQGCQGHVNNKSVSTGMSVGTWLYYDSLKHLDSSIYYCNDIFGKDFIEKKKFYKSGTIKNVEFYNNYVLYETGIDSIGIWKYFSADGKLLKRTKYTRKF